jgi:hypothetical protein
MPLSTLGRMDPKVRPTWVLEAGLESSEQKPRDPGMECGLRWETWVPGQLILMATVQKGTAGRGPEKPI